MGVAGQPENEEIPGGNEIVERRKVIIIDPQIAGMTQPYHYAEGMALSAAEKHLAMCMSTARGLAVEGIRQVAAEFKTRGIQIVRATVLLSSARPLPAELDRILNSHPLIHTAEGDFFRQAFRDALKKLDIPVSGIRENDLDHYAQKVFGKNSGAVQKKIDRLGKALGPPWAKDQKTAALAAAITLAQFQQPDKFLLAQ